MASAVVAVWLVIAMVAGGAGQAALEGVLGNELSELVGPGRAGAQDADGVSADGPSPARVVDLALDGTLRVSGRTCDGAMVGSGFVLDGRTLTNRHLVFGATEFKVDNPSARSARGVSTLVTIERRSADLDLVAGPAVGDEVFEPAEGNPSVNDTVYVAGHAGGGEALVLAGRVHLFDSGAPWGYAGEVMLIDVSTTGGFSGGPVLNAEGAVVGMLQGYSPTLDLTIAIPVEELMAFHSDADLAGRATCP